MSVANDAVVSSDLPVATLRPPYDPLFEPSIETLKTELPEILNVESLRKSINNNTAAQVLTAYPTLQHEEYLAPGLEAGDADVLLSVFSPKNRDMSKLPVFYIVHGGGQVAGNRFTGLEKIIGYFDGRDAVFISVEYRLAPEHHAPAALHDAYAGLIWTVDQASQLGIDTTKIVLFGGSGGGPVAAASAMLCRSNSKVSPCALMLSAPMLDDRGNTASSIQFARDGPWCGTTNQMAWSHVLGTARGGEAVTELFSPARATNLQGMPHTFIDVGDCEVFRDEVVAFASQLWKSGVSAELHVWPGAYHGFDLLGVGAPVVDEALRMKRSWISRILTP